MDNEVDLALPEVLTLAKVAKVAKVDGHTKVVKPD